MNIHFSTRSEDSQQFHKQNYFLNISLLFYINISFKNKVAETDPCNRNIEMIKILKKM
jgi:hypothetical protein